MGAQAPRARPALRQIRAQLGERALPAPRDTRGQQEWAEQVQQVSAEAPARLDYRDVREILVRRVQRDVEDQLALLVNQEILVPWVTRVFRV
jgi:hypothetical protein